MEGTDKFLSCFILKNVLSEDDLAVAVVTDLEFEIDFNGYDVFLKSSDAHVSPTYYVK